MASKDDQRMFYASQHRGKTEESLYPGRITIGCVCFYIALKIFLVPLKLHEDLRLQEIKWYNHTLNDTIVSSDNCRTCLDKAIAFPRQMTSEVSTLEMTACYTYHGHNITVTKPREAALGNATETWRKSWEEHADDWWNRMPLAEAPMRFDNRWLFPNFAHQTILRVGAWWPDYIIATIFGVIGIALIGMTIAKKTAAKTAVVATSVVFAGFSPYYTYRAAQMFCWDVDLAAHADLCIHVYFKNDRFTSLCFWMLCLWYASMLTYMAPLIAKFHERDLPQQDRLEGQAALACVAGTSIGALVASSLFFQGLFTQCPAGGRENLQAWFYILLGVTLDSFVVFPFLWFLYGRCKLRDTKKDQVMPY